MQTISLPIKQYETLRREAALYRTVFRKKEIMGYPIELYTDERIREFMELDKIPTSLQRKLRKILGRK